MVCNICPILIIVKWLNASFMKMHQCPIPCRLIQRVTKYMLIDKLRAIFNWQGATYFQNSRRRLTSLAARKVACSSFLNGDPQILVTTFK